MKKLNWLKLISLICVCAMLISAVVITAFAADEQESDVQIVGKNIYFGDVLKLQFAVNAPEDATISAVCNGETVELVEAGTINGYPYYETVNGWAAQNINAVVTVTVTAGDKTAVLDYSVLMYLYERLHLDDPSSVSAKQKATYEALLAYAEAADLLINSEENGRTPNNLGEYYYVSVEGGTLDGYNTWGMFKAGEKAFANIEATVVAGEGEKIQWTYTQNGAPVVTDNVDDIKALVVTGDVTVTAAVVGEDVVGDKILATFDFGENGAASHKDGSEISGSKDYTVDGYTLTLTGLSKVYGSAFDAKGNSCLKLGTSSVTATLTFTVSDDVDKVIIYVAGYKANKASVNINGETYAIDSTSDSGEYTGIEVDITVNKTVTLKTNSTPDERCMINTIQFIDVPGASGEQPEPPVECEHEGGTATCKDQAVCTKCGESYGELSTEHKYESGSCVDCGAKDPDDVPAGDDPTPITASKTVADLITEYGWTSSTTEQSFTLDDKVSVKINGGSNTGKAYNNDHIRIYATDSPAGTITISVPEGYELVSVKISTQTGTYAFLYVDGTTTDICNVETSVSGSSVLLNSVKNGSDGKQVRVTAFEVVYQPVAQ